jgi:hypothetical protein
MVPCDHGYTLLNCVGNGTQLEHQQVAVECARAIAAIFPMASDLVAKN